MFLRKWPVPQLLIAIVLVFGVAGSASATADRGPQPTVVLVHGAFADASGWNDVARSLQRKGYPVLAPANPLRGVDSDSAYLRSVLATVSGPIVLVGHSYGGFVLTNAASGNPNVKALVYIAAFAPDAGDFRGDLDTIDVPTLVIHGDDDQVVPFAVGGKASAERIKGARLITYPNAPHGITDTHKEQLGNDLLAFLNEKDT
jgi:pimeloyl-ACP methyl ester carboxylesterase